jgi:cell division protein FtsW (lipid II flippase)
LDIFSEIGIFALVVWLILILGTISCLFQVIRKTEDDNMKYLSISLIGSLVYFLVHSFFETAVYNPAILALLMVILGLSSRILMYASKDN